MEMPNTFKFYLNIAKTHVDVNDTEFIWILLVFVFFTIFVINVLQKSKSLRTFCLIKKIIYIFYQYCCVITWGVMLL